MFGSELKQLVVLDNLKEKLEMLQSDIIPGSESHPVEQSLENVPTSIKSNDGISYTTTYTTFPLSPLAGRVHFIKDSFLNISVSVNFGIHVAEKLDKPIYFYFGPRDTASIFNQIQLMIDNNVIFNTTYHHLESAIDFAGLPASVVDHSNNYATIDKLIHMKDTPMKLLCLNPEAKGVQIFDVDFQFSIDLNRLCVPLSNIDFITSNMGNLRLRVYLDKFANSFYCFQVPESLSAVLTTGTDKQIVNYLTANNLATLEPVRWGIATGEGDGPFTYSNPTFFIRTCNTVEATGTAKDLNGYVTDALTGVKTLFPVQFILHPAPSVTLNRPFMQVTRSDICQTCFDLEQSSWDKLCAYFASSGKVIIPIQYWSTNVFNNGSLQAGDAIPSTLTASLPGNNITDIAVTFTPQNAQSCLLNPYLSSIQALLDGNPLNKVPYFKIDNRAIQDITNACVDTDYDEINTDLLYSLQFPPLISTHGAGVPRDNTQYFFKVGNDTEMTYYAKLKLLIGSAANEIKNPNLFLMLFQTAIPCSFHTGMCILENSTRIPIIRLTTSGTSSLIPTIKDRYPVYTNTEITLSNSGSKPIQNIKLDGKTDIAPSTEYIYPIMSNSTNIDMQVNVSSLCDSCIILDYDADSNFCKSAYLSAAKPYLEQ